MGCLKNDAICNLRTGSHRKMGPPPLNSGPLDLWEGHKVKGQRSFKIIKMVFFHLWTPVSFVRMTLDYQNLGLFCRAHWKEHFIRWYYASIYYRFLNFGVHSLERGKILHSVTFDLGCKWKVTWTGVHCRRSHVSITSGSRYIIFEKLF